MSPNHQPRFPLQELRERLTQPVLDAFDQLVGCLDVPPDQPFAVGVMHSLARAVSTYAEEMLFNPNEHFRETLATLEQLRHELADLLYLDTTPPVHLTRSGRKHSAWRLLMEMKEYHEPLVVALGADAACALLDDRQLDSSYCRHLRAALTKLSAPQATTATDPDDLARLKFERRWFPHFQRVHKLVCMKVEEPDPSRPAGQLTALHAAVHAQGHITYLKLFPSMKHRGGAANHRHVSALQVQRVADELRLQTMGGNRQAACMALQILVSADPITILNTPLHEHRGEFWTTALNLKDGVLELNLETVFPDRRRPAHGTEALYLQSGSVVRSPLSEFLYRQLRLWAKADSRCVGDILEWPVIDARENLLPSSPSRIAPSLARAVHSLTIYALQKGVSRNVCGPLAWDFGLLPPARMYYLRLSRERIQADWCEFLAEIGWPVSAATREALSSAGSLCCLTDEAVTAVFAHLADRVRSSAPGAHSGPARLFEHHNCYCHLVAALVIFAGLLRERVVYQITAQKWSEASEFALVGDKLGGVRRVERPVALCTFVRLAIANWRAHCACLYERVASTLDPALAELGAYLMSILEREDVEMFFRIEDGRPAPVGAEQIWRSLPDHLAVVENCGRPFWLNKFDSRGCTSFEQDLALRHSAHGLENDASTHAWSLGAGLRKLIGIQDAVLAQLIGDLPCGLRRAA
jgi:hypothetical protein